MDNTGSLTGTPMNCNGFNVKSILSNTPHTLDIVVRTYLQIGLNSLVGLCRYILGHAEEYWD